MDIRGYLIVEQSPEELRRPAAANPRYRGIFRMWAIRPDLLPEEAIDPMAFSDGHGLIPDLSVAHSLVEELGRSHETRGLELIHVQTGRWGPPHEAGARYQFAGFDVACEAPFWSVVADPPPDDTIRAVLRATANDCGLFNRQSDAEEFFELYRQRFPDEVKALVLHNWEVRIVEA